MRHELTDLLGTWRCHVKTRTWRTSTYVSGAHPNNVNLKRSHFFHGCSTTAQDQKPSLPSVTPKRDHARGWKYLATVWTITAAHAVESSSCPRCASHKINSSRVRVHRRPKLTNKLPKPWYYRGPSRVCFDCHPRTESGINCNR